MKRIHEICLLIFVYFHDIPYIRHITKLNYYDYDG